MLPGRTTDHSHSTSFSLRMAGLHSNEVTNKCSSVCPLLQSDSNSIFSLMKCVYLKINYILPLKIENSVLLLIAKSSLLTLVGWLVDWLV